MTIQGVAQGGEPRAVVAVHIKVAALDEQFRKMVRGVEHGVAAAVAQGEGDHRLQHRRRTEEAVVGEGVALVVLLDAAG